MKQFFYDPSLVLYLPLYQLDGASFMSRDACGHLCAVTGALWTPQGRYFDGVDDYINALHHASLDCTAITVEVWTKISGYPATDWTDFVCKGDYKGWGIRVLSSGELWATFGGTPNNKACRISLTSSLDTWYHLAATDVVNGNIVPYLNGTMGTPVAMTTDTQFNSIHPVDIGTGKIVAVPYFKGLVGEVRIYSRALTPLEIQRNYLATKWRYQ